MKLIDQLTRFIGHAVAWLVLLMVVGTLYNVIARYFFGQFSIPMNELVIIMNAMVFLLASPLLLQLDQHVRVDVFYSQFSARKKALVDLFGTVVFLLPLCGFIIAYSWQYVKASWQQLETSPQTGGLPGLFLVKSLIILFALLLILQGISLIQTKIQTIRQPDLTTKNSDNETEMAS